MRGHPLRLLPQWATKGLTKPKFVLKNKGALGEWDFWSKKISPGIFSITWINSWDLTSAKHTGITNDQLSQIFCRMPILKGSHFCIFIHIYSLHIQGSTLIFGDGKGINKTMQAEWEISPGIEFLSRFPTSLGYLGLRFTLHLLQMERPAAKCVS